MADQSSVGRVALVTGGTKGLGKGIAEQLLRSGYSVVVCGRSTPEAPIAAGGSTATFHACDVRSAFLIYIYRYINMIFIPDGF